MVEKGSSPEQQPNPAVVEGDKNNSKKSVSVEAEEQRLRERLKHRAEEKRRKNSTDNDKDKEGKATKDQDNNNNNNSKNDDDTASKKRKHNDVVENDNEDDDDEKSPSKNRNGSRRRRRRGRRRRDRENAGRGGGAGDNRNGGRMSPQNWNRGPPPGLPPNFRDRGPPPPGWNDWDRGLPPPPPSHYGGRYGGGPGPGPGPGGPPPRGGPDDWRSGPPHPRDRDMWERDRFYDRRGNAGGGSGGGPSPPSRYGGGGGGGPGRRSRSRSRSSHSSGSSRSYSSDSRSPSRSRSRSSSRSRSPSSSVSRSGSSRSTHSYSSSHDDHSRGGGRRGRSSRLSRHRSPRHRRSRRRSRSPSADSYSSHSSGSDSNSSLSSSSTHSRRKKKKMPKEELEEKKRKDALTKDQRTVFVSQLIMRTTEKDLKRFFKKSVNCKVNDVILLKDKRTGRHKGCAYVELGRLEDVPKAIAVGGKPPDFQRFPILVKASEAEKNYVAASIHQTANAANGGSLSGAAGTGAVLLGADGKAYESQRAYIGNLDRTVTADHLKVIFSPFGQLVKIHFQKDPATGLSRGFAFLQFREPTAANLAIQTMAGQILVGRPLKTGWANQTSSVPGVELRTSEEFPDDAPTRISNAHLALAQVQGIPVPSTSTVGAATATVATAPGATAAQDAVASVAEAALDAAFGGITAPLPTVAAAAAASAGAAAVIPPPVVPTAVATTAAVMAATAPSAIAPTTTAVPGIEDNDPKKITGEPSVNLLVHNMFNKDEETEQGWEEEIRLDFEEECAKYGKISSVTIMSKEPGGKIYATFETIDGAKTCASTLAGRWFDKRQLRVEYVRDEDLPSTVKKSS